MTSKPEPSTEDRIRALLQEAADLAGLPAGWTGQVPVVLHVKRGEVLEAELEFKELRRFRWKSAFGR